MVLLALCASAAAARPYEDSAAALAGAQAARQRAESAKACQQDARQKVLELDARAVKEANELLALYELKKKALDELAQGYYCSQCGRTGSEIEAAEHIPFAQHLNNVQGRAIPAPASKLRAKAAEYDQKIANARVRVDDARQRFQAESARNTQCYNQEAAAYDEAARADAWARELKAQEALKAAQERERKLAEAKEKEKQAKVEAAKREAERQKAEQAKKLAEAQRKQLEKAKLDKQAHDEKERKLRDVEVEAAKILARYQADQAALEKKQIAMREDSERQRSDADAALKHGADTVAQLGGFPPATPPPPVPSPLPAAQAVPLENEANRVANQVLTPSDFDRESIFPSPSSSPLPDLPPSPPPARLPELAARVAEAAKNLYDKAMEPKITVPDVSISDARDWVREQRDAAKQYLIDQWQKQTQPVRDRIDELRDALRFDIRTPEERRLIELQLNVIRDNANADFYDPQRFERTREAIRTLNEQGIDTINLQLDEGTP